MCYPISHAFEIGDYVCLRVPEGAFQKVPSRVSTHSSKNFAAKSLLDPIIEDYRTTSSSEEGETMSSMSNQIGSSE